MKLQFYIRFRTAFGESLWLGGNHPLLGSDQPENALAMEYLNEDYWKAEITIDRKDLKTALRYKYYFQNKEGARVAEWGNDRVLDAPSKDIQGVILTDIWNHAGEYENAFYTTPFREVLLPRHKSATRSRKKNTFTHLFKIKAPLLDKQEAVCICGGADSLGHWQTDNPVLLTPEGDWWTIGLDLSNATFPLVYKYGVYDTQENKFIRYEEGDNRLLAYAAPEATQTVIHDGFIALPNNTWKGAGVAIPVFSLRSKNSFGVGEFSDIKLLVDWTRKTGLRLIQLLPVNDTVATHSWLDSYPYAAISAFALHPLYINLSKVAGKKYAAQVTALRKKQKQLNDLPEVDYEEVMRFKMALLKELYLEMGKECLESEDYKVFLERNRHWLLPYAAFCYYRDKYGTSHFESWKTNSVFNRQEIEKFMTSRAAAAREAGLYCFIQYHLHLQLKEAADYAHRNGVVLKGDIPIGIYRYGSDAWVAPELYNMDQQAGAPPDDFTVVGQNWGFPTYNWKKMQEDGFDWWKKRFEQMSEYFDTFRIDHILGFFRIWSIPAHAVQGILGHFVPCIPVHYTEFGENGIWFEKERFCRPFINDTVLHEVFGDDADTVRQHYLATNTHGGYDLLPEFDTQKKVEAHFAAIASPEQEKIKFGLYELVANVILFEEEGSNGQSYHFRISMESTWSYRFLIPHVQQKLRELYINYFYHRQDDFWKKEAMQKLPYLKAATNMLICGEDLGMVPHSVPEVMKELGILSLEIQRMPKDPTKPFFIPSEAPYLSVITPSTHDMSTVRAWWEENRERTQDFYNHVLGQWGDAPFYCEPWVNRAIVLQHLYSPAMWSIFQLQDILGMSDTLRRENPQEERINNPAVPQHYWRYRMHIRLEDLLNEDAFNEELKEYVKNSGR